MKEKQPIQLDERISLIDGFDMDIPSRTGTYVIQEEELTLIEVGPSPSVKYIKRGLESLSRSLAEVRYIIVTHVHLDHAGGAGFLLQQCPNATLIVHPRGGRHLIDPTKLAAGARAIYGESFSEIYDPIVPVPADRVVEKSEGDTLDIGPNCTLEFWDTPGHAKHHFSIFDPVSNGMFTGDTAGVRYELLLQDGVELYLPTTSPNHFNPNDMHASINRFAEKDVDRIYFGHFGMTENPKEALKQVAQWLDIYVEIAEEVVDEGGDYNEIARRIMKRVKEHLRGLGIQDDHEVYIIINLDVQISALGMIDYFQKIKQ
ncbi:MBL fold metallo-hydrolase [Oceanobacillus indicireducens]|uniref:MBL fold metallo-hydrolase n=1 Tax=Oceanobacillus indicireducens TaxID=1004261 RepID=A0A917XWH9_9BACI|nr:MBL fold metallo-hydrolase [Oceanobacillus indicireducens]GGN55524.1 MBL fold metallo-hydrolase [Oceanobacillus indicireducens]